MRAHRLDAAAAALTTAFLVLVTRHIPPGAGERALDGIGYALLVAAGVSVGLARRRPRAVVALVTAVLAAYVLRHYAGGPVFVTGWVALFALRRRTDRRTALLGVAAFVAAMTVVSVVAQDELSPLLLVFAGWALAAVLLGDVVANLATTREEEARRRVAEERLRIARDLHDSVAHAMATISVQAGAAEHVVDRRPEAAKEALAAIREASGTVLDELGAMLTLLRDDGPAERAPTPGLDRVPELVETSRRNGLAVELAVDGDVSRVPAAVGTAAYRVVQESLTNVVRHAPGAAAKVRVEAGGRRLTVEVTNTAGRAARPHAGTGVGLRGMRERVEATGGTLEAGPAGGGWRARAVWT